jgi:glycosyltransferase involved in cell wall biosynthesis
MISISVVIPCYNVEEYIEEGLRSILLQTKPALEVLCIDDGSTDRTVEIIKQHQKEYPNRIKLYINDDNRGATYSRNRGLAIATGDYIQFFDADDLLHADKFMHQSKVIEALPVKPDILVNSVKKLYIDGSEKIYEFKGIDPWCALLDGMMGVTSVNLFKRTKVLEVNGWNEGLKSSQEYDLMFRMMESGADVHFDKALLCTNRERVSGSITKSNPRDKWIRYIGLRKKMFDFLKKTNQLTDERKQAFINVSFDSIRILYKYDRGEALRLYNELIATNGKPHTTDTSSERYLKIYNVLGFKLTEQLLDLLQPARSKDVIH